MTIQSEQWFRCHVDHPTLKSLMRLTPMAHTAKDALPLLRNREENRTYRRESLVQAAIATVAQYDLTGTTVERICRKAGASRGLISHYFDSKEHLLIEAADAVFSQAIDVKRDIATDPTLDPEQKLKALAKSSFVPPIFNAIDIAAWQAFTNAGRSQSGYREPISRAANALQTLFAPLFIEAATRRSIPLDGTQAAFGLVTLLDGLWNSLATGKDKASVDDAIQVCEMYIDGCLARKDK